MHPADHPGPFVLVDDLDAPVLADGDRHHLERVLRARPGDALTVGDGAGRWRTARFGPSIEVTGAVIHQADLAPSLTVGFALVKGDRPETIVQKLTELGVDRIAPFRASRSVVQWDEARAAKAVTRLRSVARAAAMQSHRARIPQVDEVASLADLLGEAGVALAERDGDPPTLDRPVLLVGPEGGWSAEERRLADDRAVPRVALGGHVLRAETAAITAGALLTALRAGLARTVTD